MRWRCHLISLALVLMTWIVYFQVRNFEFVYFDDDVYVFENQHVLSGLTWDNVRWSLTHDASTETASWHPLTWLSLMLDGQFYGKDAGGYHLTSVLFHTANVLLLFAVLRRMTGAVGKSAFVAALFAVHPMQVESVTWISERKDVLSTFFGLLSLWAYVRFARRPAARWYLIALTAFVLSLLSKQMLVTLPFLLLLLDWWPLRRIQWGPPLDESTAGAADAFGRDFANEEGEPACPPRSWGRLLWEKSPFFVVTAVFCVVAMRAQQQGDALVTLEQLSFGLRTSNAVVTYVIYIVMHVWPYHLACFYPYPESIPLLDVAGSAVLLMLITLVAITQARRRPYLLVGWLWYLGTLVPVIGLVKQGAQQMADRFMYVPSVGLFIAATWLVAAVVPMGFLQRRALPCLATVILIAYTAIAWRQTSYWRDSITLFEHALTVTEKNDLIHNNLGVVWQIKDHLDKAIHHYQQAIKVEPLHVTAHVNLGKVLTMQERFNEAIEQYQTAVKIDPERLTAYNNLGSLLCEQGRWDEAVRCLRKAVTIDPQDGTARLNLGFALIGQGEFDEARRCFQEAARINPVLTVTNQGLASYHVKIGETLAALGKFPQAIIQFRAALRRIPGYADARYDLALALLRSGEQDEAQKNYIRVLLVRPDFAEAHNELGELLLAKGERELAVEHFREAVRLKPELAVARENLKRALDE